MSTTSRPYPVSRNDLNEYNAQYLAAVSISCAVYTNIIKHIIYIYNMCIHIYCQSLSEAG